MLSLGKWLIGLAGIVIICDTISEVKCYKTINKIHKRQMTILAKAKKEEEA